MIRRAPRQVYRVFGEEEFLSADAATVEPPDPQGAAGARGATGILPPLALVVVAGAVLLAVVVEFASTGRPSDGRSPSSPVDRGRIASSVSAPTPRPPDRGAGRSRRDTRPVAARRLGPHARSGEARRVPRASPPRQAVSTPPAGAAWAGGGSGQESEFGFER